MQSNIQSCDEPGPTEGSLRCRQNSTSSPVTGHMRAGGGISTYGSNLVFLHAIDLRQLFAESDRPSSKTWTTKTVARVVSGVSGDAERKTRNCTDVDRDVRTSQLHRSCYTRALAGPQHIGSHFVRSFYVSQLSFITLEFVPSSNCSLVRVSFQISSKT